eukprot:SAG31_NODE_36039_length_317_cov_0.711009_1_plen_50_part_10
MHFRQTVYKFKFRTRSFRSDLPVHHTAVESTGGGNITGRAVPVEVVPVHL